MPAAYPPGKQKPRPECRGFVHQARCLGQRVQIARLSTTPPSTRSAAPVVAEDKGEAT